MEQGISALQVTNELITEDLQKMKEELRSLYTFAKQPQQIAGYEHRAIEVNGSPLQPKLNIILNLCIGSSLNDVHKEYDLTFNVLHEIHSILQ
jgi:hypothetical protein